jgi:hypothetical protein
MSLQAIPNACRLDAGEKVMNRTTRFWMTVGMAATVGLGVLPATAWAADAKPQVAASASQSSPKFEVDDWFNTRKESNSAGYDGQDDGNWDVFQCKRLMQGTNEGMYLLWVVYD